MKCPVCVPTGGLPQGDKTIRLDTALLSGVEVDYCPKCYGLWFEEDELHQAKNEKDRSLRWLDIDLWKDIKEFRIARGMKMCPADRVPLYEVRYAAHPEDGRASPASEEARRGGSQVQVDVCNLCHGTWLDRGGFKDIIAD